MSKEIAQTVGTKRMAWLIALIAAFAVFATVGSQFRGADALLVTSPTFNSSVTGSQPIGTVVTFTAVVAHDGAIMPSTPITINFPAGWNQIGNTTNTCVGPSVVAGSLTPTAAGGTGVANYSCAVVVGAGSSAGNITYTVSAVLTASNAGPTLTAPTGASGNFAAFTASAATSLTKSNNPTTLPRTGGSSVSTITFTNNSGSATTGTVTLTDTITDAGITIAAGTPTNTGSPANAFTGCASTGPVGWPGSTIVTTASTTLSCTTTNPVAAGGTAIMAITMTAPANGAITPLEINDSASTNAVVINGVTVTPTAAPAIVTQAGVGNVELRHISDDGVVITAQDIRNNVRGSSHTVCTVDNSGLTNNPVLVPELTVGSFVVTNSGGYGGLVPNIGTLTPNFTDPQLFTGNGGVIGNGNGGNGGLAGATCLSYISTGPGDQQISAEFVPTGGIQTITIDWDTNDDGNGLVAGSPLNDSVVKEWNVLEGSTLGGLATGSNVPPSFTVTLPKTLGLTLNPSTGTYIFTAANLTDFFFGSHVTGSGSTQPGTSVALAGVNFTIKLSTGSCGQINVMNGNAVIGAPITAGNSLSGETVLVGALATPGIKIAGIIYPTGISLAFVGTNCLPSSTAQIVITGSEPGILGSGVGNTVTETVNINFAVALTTKQVFLAWAGQRVILEHDWRIAPGDVDGGASPSVVPVGTCLGLPFGRTTNDPNFSVHYIKGSGPGNFLPTLGATVSGNDDAVVSVQASDDSQTDADDIISQPQGSCISRVLYESEDPGEVDIEAFIEGSGASKVAFVVYYMKLNTVNVSLVTQVSKPTHNSSIVSDYSAGNPWDASKDAAENKADWNVSKDLLVRGRVTGWFTNTNPSGRAADTSNPLNVLPANRWVMPNDWPLLAGGPADPADGTDAKGTAEYFRPEYDIMFAPNNTAGIALTSPYGTGFVQVTTVTVVATAISATTTVNYITVADASALPQTGNILVGSTYLTYSKSATVVNRLVITGFLAPVLGGPVPTSLTAAVGTAVYFLSGTPFEGPFSLLDIPGLAASGLGGAALSDIDPNNIRDTNLPDGDVDWWDAPMPPSLVTVDIRGTGFIKQVIKSDVYYLGTANVLPQLYPNAFYASDIPDSPFITAVAAGGGYFWDTFGSDGPGCTPNAPFLCAYNVANVAANGQGAYPFWAAIPAFQAGALGTNPFGFVDATMTASNVAELAQIQGAYGDITIDRTIVVYSDNHGEFMVTANGDLKTDLTACSTNALGGGKHCKTGDKVGTGNISATADYPDFRGKHFPVLSNVATVTWLWGGYKDVTVEAGETDQYKYVVFHAMDRDGMCLGSTYSVELHPVLSSLDALNTIVGSGSANAGDPVESVNFLIDSGEGIILGTSGNPVGGPVASTTINVINDGKQFANAVPTYSIAAEAAAATGKKVFPLSSLAATGQTDECQAWIKVSNSLLGVLNVLAIAADDEGPIGFDKIIDLTNTTSYTLNFRWSLVTWAGANNIAVADALKGTGTSGKNPGGNDISASVTAIYGWDQAAQQWLGYFPSGVNVPGANDLTALKDGSAYWIAITGPGSVTWTIASNVD